MDRHLLLCCLAVPALATAGNAGPKHRNSKAALQGAAAWELLYGGTEAASPSIPRNTTTLQQQYDARQAAKKAAATTSDAAIGIMYEGWQAPAYFGRGSKGLTVESVLQSNGTLKMADMEEGMDHAKVTAHPSHCSSGVGGCTLIMK